jgi:hypothetical protein
MTSCNLFPKPVLSRKLIMTRWNPATSGALGRLFVAYRRIAYEMFHQNGFMQESPIMASKCVFPPLKVVGGETNHSIVPFIVSGRDR